MSKAKSRRAYFLLFLLFAYFCSSIFSYILYCIFICVYLKIILDFLCGIDSWHWGWSLELSKLWNYYISTNTWKSLLCTQACICQTSAQPLCRILHGIFLHWARETKRVGWEYQSLLIYLVSCGPEFVYWAWKCKAVKAFPCKWNIKIKSPFFLVCSTSKVSPWKKNLIY